MIYEIESFWVPEQSPDSCRQQPGVLDSIGAIFPSDI
jgi:hypothetical protein